MGVVSAGNNQLVGKKDPQGTEENVQKHKPVLKWYSI
jgi:hypothetical protein